MQLEQGSWDLTITSNAIRGDGAFRESTRKAPPPQMSGASMLGDDLTYIEDEGLGLSKKALPRSRALAVPIDVFTKKEYAPPRIDHRNVVRQWESFVVLSIYNLDTAHPLQEEVSLTSGSLNMLERTFAEQPSGTSDVGTHGALSRSMESRPKALATAPRWLNQIRREVEWECGWCLTRDTWTECNHGLSLLHRCILRRVVQKATVGVTYAAEVIVVQRCSEQR
jgi:hypothetical protein